MSATEPVRRDLRPGVPDVSLFPGPSWATTARDATRHGPDAYAYGDPRGRLELRSALTDCPNRTRGVAGAPGQTLVTGWFGTSRTLTPVRTRARVPARVARRA
ncbi:hypothetical protein [Streptomyces sp. NPDC059009]|uniref:hypothetical protein n=1 Tax=Streptomyces sp. NPDC059009 TaxID=3346694 RepID=UPI00367EEC56